MRTITVDEYYTLLGRGEKVVLMDATVSCGALYSQDGKQLHYSDMITVSTNNN